MSDVIAIKLITGEEIVATLDEIPKETVLLEAVNVKLKSCLYLNKPLVLQCQMTPQGQIMLAFAPWTLANQTIEQIPLEMSKVITLYKVSPQISTQYMQYTSNLILPKTPSVSSRIST